MKNVIIKIKGAQGLEDEKSVIELSTEGTLDVRDGVYVLSYTDDAMVPGAHIKTVLTVLDPNTVTLERFGALDSKLTVEKGVRSSCYYAVPEGSITLGIYGKDVRVRLNESGGSIKMVYAVDAEMRPISENTVIINIKES
ncbi:MAG: DUF1934 domain-containing protein [Clostridia bacterium]|nr:DUF1934 domain-containing protein [Clostridia bacterium]